jgi:non-specific serine/threonine protein kinase
MLAFYQGDVDAARETVEQALVAYRTFGDVKQVSGALTALAPIAFQQRDDAAARRFLEEDLALAQRSLDPNVIGHALLNLANVVHQQGDDRLARTLLEESAAALREAGGTAGVSLALHSLGVIAQGQGDYGAARAYLRESVDLLLRIDRYPVAAFQLADLGAIATVQGDYAAAASALRDSVTFIGERRERASVALVLERLARLAAALEQPERALRLAGAAATLRAATGVHLPPDVQRDLKEALEPARKALGEAGAAAAWQDGQALSFDQAVAYAREAPLGPQSAAPGACRSGPRSTGQGTALTPREQEVAALVAEGRKNREIAAALVITKATADRHVLHILGKLGFTSRVQIASWAIEHGLARRGTPQGP